MADKEPAARQQPRRRSDDGKGVDAPATWRPAGADDDSLTGVAPGQQWQRQSEGRGEEEQTGVQAGEMQPEQRQRGSEGEGQRDAQARGHRIGTFSVVVYSSKSETRSVTASFQSPPGTSCSVLAT